MLGFLKNKFLNWKNNRIWRKRNSHNSTYIMGNFNLDLVHVGKYTYGDIQVLNFGTSNHLYIGNFCSIASEVKFIVCADHNLKTMSTFPFKVKCLQTEQYEAISKGDIVVDDDVWIGQNAIILSGVHIGQGAVIAAGSVVTKDIEPYSIVAGVPAKEIGKRFDDAMIDELMKIDYSKLDKNMIKDNINSLYSKLNSVELINWMPKKQP